MSSDAEEFDLHQLDQEIQSSDNYSGDDGEEHSHTRRRSRKRKHAETALGPLDVYESLGESEMEEENARKRKNRRLGVNERRELTGYSQLMRTLETDHVQDVGSHIVNFHRSLVMEPLETPDQPLKQMSKEERPPRETGAPRVVTNLKSAWPLQPSAIQIPKFSLVDEVRAIAQRHVETQPNRHPLTSTAHENFPGPSDPSGSHPHLPDAAVNALAVRTKVLLDQVLGLLHQYRPATAPSTQLRAPPMNWELVLDILAEHDVVDPAKDALSVIERTKARLEKILGSKKNKKVRNRSGSTGSAEPSLSAKSSDSASPRGYLSYLDDDLAFLDNVQEVQKRSQAKRDAQQLLLKLTRKNLNSSENGTTPPSKSPSDETVQGSSRSESPEYINTENAGLPASPMAHEGERSDFKDDVEPLRASSEDSSTGSGEDDQDEDERATPGTVQTGNDERLPPIDDSPSKTINGWTVHAPSEESEESSDEGEGQEGNEIVVNDEVDELEGEAGSKQEDDQGEDESVTSSTETSPQTDSDPLFGGDAQCDSDESESADELSEDDETEGYYGGEVSANKSDRSVSKRVTKPGEPSNQDLPTEEPHADSSPSGSEDEETEEEDEAAPAIRESPSLTESAGGDQSGTPEEVEEDSSDEEDAKAAGNHADNDTDSASSPLPEGTSMPRGFVQNDIGEDGSPQGDEKDADRDEEKEDSEVDEELGDEGPEEEGGPIEAKDLFTTTSRLPSVTRPESGDDAEMSEEEPHSDDDNVEREISASALQEHWRKTPSSASRHRSDSDGEGIEEESEWEGVAGKDSDSDSELEGSE